MTFGTQTDDEGRMTRRIGPALGILLSIGLALSSLPAHAEGKLRVAQQFGIVYLLLNVAQDQNLIEKHGKALGLDIDVEYIQLSGGSAVNDALLSGSIDIAAAGVGPLFTIWDKTRGRLNVRGVASLGNLPYYLVSTNPKVKTIADLTAQDKIALPATTVSVQSRILQWAAAKLWGDEEYGKLDRFTVSFPHPEAAAALTRGGTEITGHFGSPPFQEQELAGNPAAHVVLNSYEVQGGPSSSTILYGTEKFYKESPKTYRAFLDALDEAASFIRANPSQAADIYLKISGAKTSRDLVLKIITNPEVVFKVEPQNTLGLGQFLHRVGAIKNEPTSLKDYFFDDPRTANGS